MKPWRAAETRATASGREHAHRVSERQRLRVRRALGLDL